jgi:hypothetical protein
VPLPVENGKLFALKWQDTGKTCFYLRIVHIWAVAQSNRKVRLMKFVLEINSMSYNVRPEMHEDIKNNLSANIFIYRISEKRIKYGNILKRWKKIFFEIQF